MTVWRLCSCRAKMVLNRLWHQRGHRLTSENVEAFSRLTPEAGCRWEGMALRCGECLQWHRRPELQARDGS